MAIDAQFWSTAGFTALIGLIAFIAFMAYWSLRRMDDVVLRARMYMNRKRLFAGFLAVAVAMITLFVLVLVGLVFVAADLAMPSTVSLGLFVVSFAFLGVGCYNFYALSRPPTAQRRPAPEVE